MHSGLLDLAKGGGAAIGLVGLFGGAVDALHSHVACALMYSEFCFEASMHECLVATIV